MSISKLLSFLPSCHLPPSHLRLGPWVFLLAFAVLKKVKDSRCGTPLLLNQLPHQCIILPNLTSLPTQSFSLPATLTRSPPPTRFFPFFHVFPSSLHPCEAPWLTNYSGSRQLAGVTTTGSLYACSRRSSWLTWHRAFSHSQPATWGSLITRLHRGSVLPALHG